VEILLAIFTDDPAEFVTRILSFDDDVTRGGVGLREVPETGELEDPRSAPKTRLTELRPGQRYMLAMSAFEKWRHHESAGMELETGRAILNYAKDNNIILTPLEKVIKDAKTKLPQQEWDAAFFDYANNQLYLCEAKHRMRRNDAMRVERKINALPDVIKNATADHANLKPTKTLVFLAGITFSDDVKEFADRRAYTMIFTSGRRYRVDSLETISTSGSSGLLVKD
jgi:hypothetical protein